MPSAAWLLLLLAEQNIIQLNGLRGCTAHGTDKAGRDKAGRRHKARQEQRGHAWCSCQGEGLLARWDLHHHTHMHNCTAAYSLRAPSGPQRAGELNVLHVLLLHAAASRPITFAYGYGFQHSNFRGLAAVRQASTTQQHSMDACFFCGQGPRRAYAEPSG